MILAFLRMVPTSVWIGLVAAIALLSGIWWLDHNGYERGASVVQAEFDAYRVAAEEALQKERARQARVVEKVVVEYRDRVKIVKEKGDEIIKEVPVLVHGDCNLTGGWRVLHDAAATGSLPDDPGRAAAAADPVEDTAAAETVAGNYAICRADQARLGALQQLLKGISP
jgi:hypothetical protein